mmetsp:Transcript_24384/g.82223  ORF Transcript_24384/g.82223 Transcript_24384/m.82223 type:complete len:266 (+) Transcript_24384:3028-3825(+)
MHQGGGGIGGAGWDLCSKANHRYRRRRRAARRDGGDACGLLSKALRIKARQNARRRNAGVEAYSRVAARRARRRLSPRGAHRRRDVDRATGRRRAPDSIRRHAPDGPSRRALDCRCRRRGLGCRRCRAPDVGRRRAADGPRRRAPDSRCCRRALDVCSRRACFARKARRGELVTFQGRVQGRVRKAHGGRKKKFLPAFEAAANAGACALEGRGSDYWVTRPKASQTPQSTEAAASRASAAGPSASNFTAVFDDEVAALLDETAEI